MTYLAVFALTRPDIYLLFLAATTAVLLVSVYTLWRLLIGRHLVLALIMIAAIAALLFLLQDAVRAWPQIINQ